MSNGKYTILDVAIKSKAPFKFVCNYANQLKEKKILEFNENII